VLTSWVGYRALRLLLANPRLFVTRVSMILRMFLRDPAATIGAVSAARKRREQIERGYQLWLEGETDAIQTGAGTTDGPLLSVIMPVFNTDDTLLEEAIRSVLNQTYSRWELCIADDASAKPSIRPLLDQFAAADSRIRVTYREASGHISAASNSAVELASGDFVILLDHDDVLTSDALCRIAEVIRDESEVDFIYSDEDKIDEEGNRSQPFFKPAWSPTLLTSCNYITHLAAIRRTLVLEVGGFRDDMVGSQDHDLFLRIAEKARAIAHIPRVLYSWRMTRGSTSQGPSAKPYAMTAARRALEDAIQRQGLSAVATESHLNGIFFLRHRLQPPLRVSLVVVGRGKEWREVLQYGEIDVCDVVFLDQTQSTEVGVPIVTGIDALRGAYLVFIDASSKPAGAESVTSLLEHLQNAHVGVVGGTTRAPDGTVLQAGIAMSDGGQPVYAYAGLSMLPQPNFYLNLKDLPREVSAVFVGCCAIRRKTWIALGGWNRTLSPDLAMCEFCFRARARGYSAVYTPLARFQRAPGLEGLSDVEVSHWTWHDLHDPFWNPNMNPASAQGIPFRQWQTPARVQRARACASMGAFDRWVRDSEALGSDTLLVAGDIRTFEHQPLISVILLLCDSDKESVSGVIDGVLHQYYPHWELLVCANSCEWECEITAEYVSKEERIRVLPGDESAASLLNRASQMATGEFLALLGGDGKIARDAFYWIVRALQTIDADVIYTDENKVDLEGRHCEPSFKPAWSPDLLLSGAYIPRFSVVRKSLVDRIGGFAEVPRDVWTYDLLLRVTEHTSAVLHIPRLLYHERRHFTDEDEHGEHPGEPTGGAAVALAEAMHRRGVDADIRYEGDGVYRVKRAILGRGKISIVIPTRDNVMCIRRCVESIESRNDYLEYEIIIVDNGSETGAMRRYLRSLRHKVIRDDGAFNYSRLINLGARTACGDYLLLLNDDTEIISSESLTALVEQAQRPEVGAVGGLLLYPDGLIQHAGVVLGVGGVAGHAHKRTSPFGYDDLATSPMVIRNYSAVTGACMMVRRDLFAEVGGLNEAALGVSFNDVDLCLRLHRLGFLVVYTPYAVLRHSESATRTLKLDQDESAYMWSMWGHEILEDLYYNPNLTTDCEDFAVDLSRPEGTVRTFAQDTAEEVAGPISRHGCVGQRFRMSGESLSGIAIRFATYAAVCTGRVRLCVRDVDSQRDNLVQMEIDAASIRDSEYYRFFFAPQAYPAGKELYFFVEFQPGKDGGSLAIWKSAVTDSRIGPCLVDCRPASGTLSFQTYTSAFRVRAPSLHRQ